MSAALSGAVDLSGLKARAEANNAASRASTSSAKPASGDDPLIIDVTEATF
jgi:putative thioredoxin